MKINSIVILCGGYGKRISNLTKITPKILINIGKKPFLHHQIKIFKKNKIKNIYFLTYYKSTQIRNYAKKLKDFNCYLLNDGKIKLGTGGSLKKNLDKMPDYFYLTYGDSYLDFDYSVLEDKILKTNKNVMTIYKNKSKKHFNNILVSKKKIVEYSKDKKLNYIDYGLFLFRKKDLKNIKSKKKFDLGEYISYLIKNNNISYVISHKKFHECGSYEGIKKIEKIIKAKNQK